MLFVESRQNLQVSAQNKKTFGSANVSREISKKFPIRSSIFMLVKFWMVRTLQVSVHKWSKSREEAAGLRLIVKIVEVQNF